MDDYMQALAVYLKRRRAVEAVNDPAASQTRLGGQLAREGIRAGVLNPGSRPDPLAGFRKTDKRFGRQGTPLSSLFDKSGYR